MDHPGQDFASAGDFGDGQAGNHDTAPDAISTGATAIDPATIAHLVDILGEAGRITAKCRLLFHGIRDGTGLSGSEMLTLAAMIRAAAPSSVPQIGRFLGSPRQVVQRAFKAMERDGLIAPLPDQDHKRAPLFEVTARGYDTIAVIDAAALDTMAVLAGSMPKDTLDTVHEGVTALREQIDRMLGMQDIDGRVSRPN